MTLTRISLMLSLTSAILVAACGGSSSTTPTSPSGAPTAAAATVYQGTLAGLGGKSGTIDVTVQNASASGTLRVTGASPASLSGGYDSAARSVQLSGGGVTLTGTVSANVLSGTISGATTGGFSTVSAEAGQVTRYCGTYLTSGPGYTETGTWNIQVASNGVVSGIHAAVTPAAECCGYVTGRRDGNTVTFTTQENKTVTGTIEGNTLSGSQPNGSGTTSFRGTTDACQ